MRSKCWMPVWSKFWTSNCRISSTDAFLRKSNLARFRRGNNRSPGTNIELPSRQLLSLEPHRKVIEAYLQNRPEMVSRPTLDLGSHKTAAATLEGELRKRQGALRSVGDKLNLVDL